MIRYSLNCAKSHAFEAWFQSSTAYDTQLRRGLVTCPVCGGKKISKAPMAPNVSPRSKRRRDVPGPAAAAVKPAGAQQAMTPSPEQREMLAVMRKIRADVEKKSEYVGPRFAEEARKIHHDEVPARGIYGEATREEVEALHQEGVECYPLPVLPEDKN